MSEETVKLGHGSGGTLTHRLIEETILRAFPSPRLASLPDSATIETPTSRIAFTTDSYVVDPVFFPGGDIGKLAVCGTVNDLAMVGAIPRYVSCALIVEEGLPMADLRAVLDSMAKAAEEAGVEVVTGDTKVVPRGKADRLFVNTAGVGFVPADGPLPGGDAEPGDIVIVSGPIGDHGAAVLAEREGLNLESSVQSDCAPLTEAAQAVLGAARRVPFLRDLTRGGLATIMNECTGPGRPGVLLREADVPVREEVRSICELLGLDPLYLACEGRLVAVVDAESADIVLRELGVLNTERGCAAVGVISERYEGKVALETPLGTRRLLQMLSGEQLPRIC